MYRDDDEKVKDSFQAFLVQDAKFTKKEEYPIIRKDMVPTCPPKKVMPFSKAITYQGDLSQYCVYFYSMDETFERVRRNPRRYVSFFKKCNSIIGLDFSVHSDMPLVKQKAQMNDNLSLSYFFGNNGIPIYPNCRGGADCLNDEYLKSFPKRTYIALGVHGFIQTKEQRHEWRIWIDTIVKRIKPKGFIIIGHLPKNILSSYQVETEFHVFDSLIEERKKETMCHVN